MVILWAVLPHRFTGPLKKWLQLSRFENLHECSTVYCPLNRVRFPEARRGLEDTVITSCQDVVKKTGQVHLVSFGAGGLFSEAVLLSRLMESETGLTVTVSLINRGWKPIAEINSKNLTKIESRLREGYNQEFHDVTIAQLENCQQLINRLPGDLQVRCYGDPSQLAAEIAEGELPNVDVFTVMDPGLEPFIMYPCVLDGIELSQKVSNRTEGVFILGWAEGTSAVVRKFMAFGDDLQVFKKHLESRGSFVEDGGIGSLLALFANRK